MYNAFMSEVGMCHLYILCLIKKSYPFCNDFGGFQKKIFTPQKIWTRLKKFLSI